ncbi:MAG: 23S rRNA (adenine(2503)-C(2))-methyltransferase RlmN [Chloroflexi bacterium]|nr:23S rRNA (adenine(2503)-C(2))-methyltransferase RlmN [Chloroflexota bacterium]
MRPKITDLSLDQLKSLVRSYGQPDYTARQIFRWLYQGLASSFDEMTDLPAALRKTLASQTTPLSLRPIEQRISDNGKTTKVLFELEDGQSVESVLMLYDGREKGQKRNTVCISTQVGCPIGCPFCATGQQGFERDLSPGEIVEQVLYFQRQLAARRYDKVAAGPTPPRITNVVFMGMGEPLANYESIRQSLETLASRQGLGFGARRVTISTAGLVPQIRRLAQEKVHAELAISLHASSNELRNMLVPINRKYPLEMLLPAATEYFERTGRRPTFEYVLFRGINDSVRHARDLAHLLLGLNCHVNLIPASPTLDRKFLPPSMKQVLAFQRELTRCGVSNTLRVSRGLDIEAACGQLRSRCNPSCRAG